MFLLCFNSFVDLGTLHWIGQCFHHILASLSNVLDASGFEALQQRKYFFAVLDALLGVGICNTSSLGCILQKYSWACYFLMNESNFVSQVVHICNPTVQS